MRLLYGVGVTDIPTNQDGARLNSYTIWKDILYRCYSDKRQKRQPTYAGCSVCKEWHIFSNFKRFYDANYVEGYHLDKDLLVVGNKEYSPEACLFVPRSINAFLNFNKGRNKSYPIGASFNKREGKFVSRINIDGTPVDLGRFECPKLANEAWVKEKLSLAKAKKQLCDSIHPALYSSIVMKIEQQRVDRALGQ